MESKGSSDNSDQKLPNKMQINDSLPDHTYPTHLKRTRDARKAPVYCAPTDKRVQRALDKPIAAYIPT